MLAHEIYMKRCIDLAINGLGNTFTNPLVGAVVVHESRIIGEGYHAVWGGPHAEVMALASVQWPELLTESTLYVSLEPCSHQGKTPPCVQLILEKKIPRVVVGSLDPNPLVNGTGIQLLKDAGVEVIPHVLADACEALNPSFFRSHRNKRAFVSLKWAQSADGKIDGLPRNSPVRITGENSAVFTHHLRRSHPGIVVGWKTLENDKPALTTRLVKGSSPIPLILDAHLRATDYSYLLAHHPEVQVWNRVREEKAGNITFCLLPDTLEKWLQLLYSRGITSILVEGGSETLNGFLTSGCWDKLYLFSSDVHIGEGIQAPARPVFDPVQKFSWDSDQLFIYEKPI